MPESLSPKNQIHMTCYLKHSFSLIWNTLHMFKSKIIDKQKVKLKYTFTHILSIYLLSKPVQQIKNHFPRCGLMEQEILFFLLDMFIMCAFFHLMLMMWGVNGLASSSQRSALSALFWREWKFICFGCLLTIPEFKIGIRGKMYQEHTHQSMLFGFSFKQWLLSKFDLTEVSTQLRFRCILKKHFSQ